ncbi:hypothetical protein RB600_006504 [Gaeumannomyces tritici]
MSRSEHTMWDRTGESMCDQPEEEKEEGQEHQQQQQQQQQPLLEGSAAANADRPPPLVEQRRLPGAGPVRSQPWPQPQPQPQRQPQHHYQQQHPLPPQRQGHNVFTPARRPPTGPAAGRLPPRGPAPRPPAGIPRAFETPLDSRFALVEKPKRFFTVGRIFKTVWFEPGGTALAGTPGSLGLGQQQRQDVDYAQACPAFHSEKPHAKFRWFVVVRRRLHHSLCFSITTSNNGRNSNNGGGNIPGGPRQGVRGRPRDFVVLYSAAAAAAAAGTSGEAPTGPTPRPPSPMEGEGIDRAPLGVIIEDGAQAISPLARLDCGRIYTVEDNVKVMKIGRIHTDGLKKLDEYFRESVS